jgi:acetyltransferase-like isoleucine patch superfamily enzyme
MSFPSFGSEPYLISIGPKVVFSFGVVLVTHDGGTNVFRNRPECKGVRRYGRITIHENTFVGAHAMILPGVTIGPNSVVGAGAVVISDVAPNTVVWGNPARPLMTVDAYAEKCMAKNETFDEQKYRADKRAEILRVYPYPW